MKWSGEGASKGGLCRGNGCGRRMSCSFCFQEISWASCVRAPFTSSSTAGGSSRQDSVVPCHVSPLVVPKLVGYYIKVLMCLEARFATTFAAFPSLMMQMLPSSSLSMPFFARHRLYTVGSSLDCLSVLCNGTQPILLASPVLCVCEGPYVGQQGFCLLPEARLIGHHVRQNWL